MVRPEPDLTWDADDSFEFIDQSELLHLPHDLDKIAVEPNRLNTPEYRGSKFKTRKADLTIFLICCLIVFTLAAFLHTEHPAPRTEPVSAQDRRPREYPRYKMVRAVLHGNYIYVNETGFPIEEKKLEGPAEPEPTWPIFFPDGDSDLCPTSYEWYHRDWICDGMDDCVGGFDERNCGKRKKGYLRLGGMKRLEESERMRILTILEESSFPNMAHRGHVHKFLAQMRESSMYWWIDRQHNLYSKNITTGVTARFHPFRQLMYNRIFDQTWHYAVVKKMRGQWSWTWIEERTGDDSVQQDFVPIGCPRCLESSELRSQYQECIELGWTCRTCDDYYTRPFWLPREPVNSTWWLDHSNEHQMKELMERAKSMSVEFDKAFDKAFEEERRAIGEKERVKRIEKENEELVAKLAVVEERNDELETRLNFLRSYVVSLERKFVDMMSK